MNRKLLVSAMLMVTMQCIMAQKSLRKAEVNTESYQFDQAVNSYAEYFSTHPNDDINRIEAAKLALSCHAYDRALSFLEPISSESPLYWDKLYWQAKIYMNKGNYPLAKDALQTCASLRPYSVNQEIRTCDFALSSEATAMDWAQQVPLVDADCHILAYTTHQGMPMYMSDRNDMKGDILVDESTRKIRNFLVDQNKNRLNIFQSNKYHNKHIGQVHFNEERTAGIYIMADAIMPEYISKGGLNSQIVHFEVNERGEIFNEVPSTLNEMGAQLHSAYLDKSGSIIYFSANKSDGFGGYDIYVSYLVNGSWTLPHNLGQEINSPFDEITPFFMDNTLYFSSNGTQSLGGFDILYAQLSQGTWTSPSPLHVGINSAMDEIFPYTEDMHTLYFSSNNISFPYYRLYQGQTDEESIDVLAMQMPKATSLADLSADIASKAINEVVAEPVSLVTNTEGTSFHMPDISKAIKGQNDNSLSLADAYRVALDQPIPLNQVYFVQLASLSETSSSTMERFKGLLKWGNIYTLNAQTVTKIRLGYYEDRGEAERILAHVRSKGFKDAFITLDKINATKMELVLTRSDLGSMQESEDVSLNNPSRTEIKNGVKYKVRLASYEDPIWFDVNKVKDIGRIEQWSKGGWTIFILAGFDNYEEAKSALIKSKNRGFDNAEIVIDNGGILERFNNY